MADVEAVLETCLYTEDLPAARQFYGELLGLTLVSEDPHRHLFFRCGPSMLLVFDLKGLRQAQVDLDGVQIPSHGAQGPVHVAFRVRDAEQIEVWHGRLLEAGVAVEAIVDWPHDGRSIYVRDPHGNSVELATGALWNF